MCAPTEKQLAYIKAITDEIGVKFKGTTKAEARAWLTKYVPEYKNYMWHRQLDNELEMEAIDARRDW
jgi:oligoribonuclease (3'-5' exoribonuclease)